MTTQAGPSPTLYLLDYLDRRPLSSELLEACRQLLPLVLAETRAESSSELSSRATRAEEIDQALLRLKSSGGTATWLIDRLRSVSGDSKLGAESRAAHPRSQHQRVGGNYNVSLQVGESVHGGIHLGALPQPISREAVEQASPPTLAPAAPTPTSQRPEPRRPTPLPRSDLEIVVTETVDSGVASLIFEVTASDQAWLLDHQHFGPVPIQREPEAHALKLFEIIDAKRSLSGSRDSDLRDLGADLARQLLGTELMELLWSLRHRATTLLIGPSPPWIPWELIYLSGPSGAGQFLCEAFALSRWPSDLSPILELPLRRLAVVTPDGGAGIAAPSERSFLLGLQSPARSICPVAARYEIVLEAMASGGYDGWHFIGHGRPSSEDANLAAIGLDSYQTLTPKVLSREAAGLGRGRPLVFLNGCHTGRSGFALTSAGGWAHQFLAAGAGAFLGAQWQVHGKRAAAFTRAFYDGFLAGAPISQAVRQARRAVFEPGDSTWLAYTLFAHPLASSQAWRNK